MTLISDTKMYSHRLYVQFKNYLNLEISKPLRQLLANGPNS